SMKIPVGTPRPSSQWFSLWALGTALTILASALLFGLPGTPAEAKGKDCRKLLGQGWSTTDLPPNFNYYSVDWSLAVDPFRPDRIYISDGDGTIWRSENGGCNWSAILTKDGI